MTDGIVQQAFKKFYEDENYTTYDLEQQLIEGIKHADGEVSQNLRNIVTLHTHKILTMKLIGDNKK